MLETLRQFGQPAIEKILTVTIGLMLGLIGVIYKITVRRIDRHEKQIDILTPKIIQIASDVKHIKQHCVLCREIGGRNDVSGS